MWLAQVGCLDEVRRVWLAQVGCLDEVRRVWLAQVGCLFGHLLLLRKFSASTYAHRYNNISGKLSSENKLNGREELTQEDRRL